MNYLLSVSLFFKNSNFAVFLFIFRTIILLTLFSQIMTEVKVPGIKYSSKHGLKITWFNLFKLFPVSCHKSLDILISQESKLLVYCANNLKDQRGEFRCMTC